EMRRSAGQQYHDDALGRVALPACRLCPQEVRQGQSSQCQSADSQPTATGQRVGNGQHGQVSKEWPVPGSGINVGIPSCLPAVCVDGTTLIMPLSGPNATELSVFRNVTCLCGPASK